MLRAVALLASLSSLAIPLVWTTAKHQDAQSGFSHAGHVSDLWPDEEFLRDCRGCHDYKNADPKQNPPPKDLCKRCHVLGSMQVRHDAGYDYVDPAREAERTFRHSDHQNERDGGTMACARCHAALEALEEGLDATVGPPIEVPQATVAFCAQCHSEEPEADRDSFNSGLTRYSAELLDRETPRPFRHAQHLRPDELAPLSSAACKQCHAHIERADALHLSEHQVQLDGCAECHAGMEFKLEAYSKASLTAATFVHDYHLGTDTNKGLQGLDKAREGLEKGCAACHEWSAVEETFVVQEFLSAPGGGQEGCVTCHLPWQVPAHGESDVCAQCHAVEEHGFRTLASQQSNRPRVKVLRADPGAFALAERAHPFVHGPDGPIQDCARCHLAVVERAPARAGRPFRHDLHLPEDFATLPAAQADPAACRGCHRTVAEAVRINEVTGTRHGDLGSGASYNFDFESCDRCHGAGVCRPLDVEPVQEREALRFDHRAHLGREHPKDTSRTMTCVDCHRLESGAGDWAIVSDDKVADCTLCHGHDVEREKVTAGLDAEAVESCTHCHAPGIPQRGAPVKVERARIGSVSGSQAHQGYKPCSDCHQVPAEGATSRARSEKPSGLLGVWTGTRNPHGSPRQGGNTWYYFQDVAACVDCHWGNMGRTSSHQDEIKAQKRSPHLRVREAATLLQRKEYREHFGDELKNFPGAIVQ